jgi:cytochrome oxidase assembly protein ShyY1
VRSLRFLVSRRWVLFAIAVAVAAYGAWLLGEWQFHRLADRKASNAIVVRNTAAPPAAVEDVLAPGRPAAATDEWRVVEATGEYAPEDTVIVRYRTRDGASGADVVVPLVTSGGTALLVDRGWLATDNLASEPIDVPAPPPGEVDVTGWVRVDATGDSTAVSSNGGTLSTRAISSDQIGEATDRQVYGGFVDLRSEDPEPETPLERAELPELDNGPHFFYGLQWWFFGILAIVGFGYLAFDEWRKRERTDGSRPRSEGPQHPAVDGQHGAVDERRRR